MKIFGGVTTPGTTGKAVTSADWTGSAWPARPVGGTEVRVLWIGPTTAPLPSDWASGDVRIKF